VTKGGKSLAKKVARISWKLFHEIEFFNTRGVGWGGVLFACFDYVEILSVFVG
jgi:hypothetical protein